MKNLTRVAALLIAAGLAPASFAQYPQPTYAPPVYAPPPAPAAAYAQQDLDGMLAPVALYPDPLLSQILVAATYPREVAAASQWLRSNPGLSGDAAVRAAAPAGWDPSVQALCAFPQVLAMMEANPQWTEDLGEAFLAEQPRVMDTVQALRQRAWAAGTLRPTQYSNVYSQGRLILIQPVQPQLVYVPYYDPLVVYGRWWHPVAPVRWNPWPGYVARPGGFYWGPAVTISVGNLFARFDWQHRAVNVVHVNAPPRVWVHEAVHRRGEPYRVEAVRRVYVREEPRRVEPRVERREEIRREERHEDIRRDERRERRGAVAVPPRAEVQHPVRVAQVPPVHVAPPVRVPPPVRVEHERKDRVAVASAGSGREEHKGKDRRDDRPNADRHHDKGDKGDKGRG